MPPPILSAPLWLGPSDVPKIQAVVDAFVVSILAGLPMLPVTKRVSLGVAAVVSNGVAGLSPLPRDIRGATNRVWDNPVSPSCATSITVVLNNIPETPDQAAKLRADIPGFRLAMGALLAHEFTHVRQIEVGGGSFKPDVDAAAKASSDAQRSRGYADYIAYVGQPLEIAAHATQLAYEVQHAIGSNGSQAAFDAQLGASWLWNYLQTRTDFQVAPGDDRAALFARIETALRENAFWAYQHIWP